MSSGEAASCSNSYPIPHAFRVVAKQKIVASIATVLGKLDDMYGSGYKDENRRLKSWSRKATMWV